MTTAPQHRLEKPRREVLAFYYRGRANPQVSGAYKHWQGPNKEAPAEDPVPDQPILGMYDSNDTAVITQHAKWLKAAGCTGVIFGAWTRAGWEEREGGRRAQDIFQAQGLKCSVYLEGQKNGLEGARDDFAYLQEHLMTHPSWLRVGDRPVVLFYRRAFRELPASQWRAAAKTVAAAAQSPEPVLVGDMNEDDPAFAEKSRGLDGVHRWSVVELVAGKTPLEAAAILAHAMPAMAIKTRDFPVQCATVMAGWNDLLITRRPYPRPTTDRFGTGMLDTFWAAARAARPDYVLVNDFNGFHNGSEIEPSKEWGESALVANARNARLFQQGR